MIKCYKKALAAVIAISVLVTLFATVTVFAAAAVIAKSGEVNEGATALTISSSSGSFNPDATLTAFTITGTAASKVANVTCSLSTANFTFSAPLAAGDTLIISAKEAAYLKVEGAEKISASNKLEYSIPMPPADLTAYRFDVLVNPGDKAKDVIVVTNRLSGAIAKTDTFSFYSSADGDAKTSLIGSAKPTLISKEGTAFRVVATLKGKLPPNTSQLWVTIKKDKAAETGRAQFNFTPAPSGDDKITSANVRVSPATGKAKQEVTINGLSENDQAFIGADGKSGKGKVKKDSTSITLTNKGENLPSGTTNEINILLAPYIGTADINTGIMIDEPRSGSNLKTISGVTVPNVVTQSGGSITGGDVKAFIIDNVAIKNDVVVLYGLTPGSAVGAFNFKTTPTDSVLSKLDFLKAGVVKAGTDYVIFDKTELAEDFQKSVFVLINTGENPTAIKKDTEGVRTEITKVNQ